MVKKSNASQWQITRDVPMERKYNLRHYATNQSFLPEREGAFSSRRDVWSVEKRGIHLRSIGTFGALYTIFSNEVVTKGMDT